MSSNLKYIFLGVLCICLILCSTCVFAIDNTTYSENEESNSSSAIANTTYSENNVTNSSSNMTVATDEPVEIQPDNIIPEEHEVLPSDINFERFNNFFNEE